MRSMEWRFLDRMGWAQDGAWENEPDKLQFNDEATGLPTVITRSPIGGNLCGYVGVPPGHRLHGTPYNSVDLLAHGGVNFSDFCIGREGPYEGVCHIPEPGEPANVWWFGFDCAHARDLMPALRFKLPGAAYRDLRYVKAHCASLAQQLSAIVA